MKKIIALLFVTAFVLSLVSCKSQKENPSDSASYTEKDASSIVSYPIYDVTSPIYTDLTLEHFKKLYVGMPFEEAIKIVGAPHKSETFENIEEASVRHYYTALNGREYIIHYKNGAIEVVQYPTDLQIEPQVKKDLTMADVDKLYIGMPYEEAIEILGAPHRNIGFGMIRDVYKLTNGKEWVILYRFGAIAEIYEFNPETA